MDGGRPTAGEKATGESRRHFRGARKLPWPVELELARAPREGALPTRIRAQALGVSLGGTFVATDELLPVDTDLHLWLYPPRALPPAPRVLRLLARVRWINPTDGEQPRGFGVAFRALTAADEVALHGSFSRLAKVI